MSAPASSAGSVAVTVDALLEHRVWVRRVARALVSDEADADDLEQEVWLRALEKRPRDGDAARGWLRAVLRHTARDLWRARTRRRRIEATVSPPAATASTADLVAEADAHRRVVDAVMDLREPYRATLLLRYFHDLPVADVARRTGAPLETTRARLRRGLALLRSRFDSDCRGDRQAWVALVLPLTRGARTTAGTSAIVGAAAAVTVAVAGLAAGLLALRKPSADVAVAVAPGTGGAVELSSPPARAHRSSHVARADATPTPSLQRAPPTDDTTSEVGAPTATSVDTKANVRAASPQAAAGLATPAAFDEAFSIVHDPGEAEPERLRYAIGLLRGFVAARVHEGQCHVGIGRCLFRLGKLREAKEELETGLRGGGFGDFTRSWARLRLGCIADLDGLGEQATSHYRAVLDLADAPNMTFQKRRARRFLERPYRGYAIDG